VKETTQKFIQRSQTIKRLLEKYPEGTEVEMPVIEEDYLYHSSSKKTPAQIRARGRHIYLRLVEEGFWRGSTEPYVKIIHGDCFEWAHKEHIQLVDGGMKLKGKKALQYRTVAGNYQSIELEKVKNLVELNQLVTCQNKES